MNPALRQALDKRLRQQCMLPLLERVTAGLQGLADGRGTADDLGQLAAELARDVPADPGAHLVWWFPPCRADARAVHALNAARLGALVAHAEGRDAERHALMGLTYDAGMWVPEAAAVLHDRPLDADGHELLALLPKRGAALVRELGSDVALAAARHHERADGTGYPDSLPRNRLDAPSVLFQVIDSFLGQVEPRGYRRRRNPLDAMGRLLLQAERGHYDLPAFRTFARALGFYPFGSVVRLSTGEHALITGLNELDPQRPEVELLSDQQGTPRTHPVPLNLTTKPTIHIEDAE
jgi:HD-GYP domain-containing protein (c-di-GMP phosphodiesterase class II)